MPLELIGPNELNFKDRAVSVIKELESLSDYDNSPAKRAIACVKKGLEELDNKNEEIQALNTENCLLKKELSHANETINKIAKNLQRSEEKQVSYSELRNAFLTIINVFSE